MSHLLRISCLVMGVVVLTANTAWAGMPSISLSDMARMRLQSISFFGAGILLSAWLVQRLWNSLRKDFTKLPRLSYRVSLAATVLWGLLFLFVLTMISGARELMTPGAWEKQGFTYRLSDGDAPETEGAQSLRPTLADRRGALEQLRSALWLHAATHEGRFPESIEQSEFADKFWCQPGFSSVRYGYRPGLSTSDSAETLAFEQGVYDDGVQLMLLVDGSIRERAYGSADVTDDISSRANPR